MSEGGHDFLHSSGGYGWPPNYYSDLNAVAELEKGLTDEQRRKARWMLVQIKDDNFATWNPDEYEQLDIWEMSLDDIDACLLASPAQRCEALLRTLGKWPDQPTPAT